MNEKPNAEQAIRFLYSATEMVQMTPEQRKQVLVAYDIALAGVAQKPTSADKP